MNVDGVVSGQDREEILSTLRNAVVRHPAFLRVGLSLAGGHRGGCD